MTDRQLFQPQVVQQGPAYSAAAAEFFTSMQWVTLAYGVRAHLADLQTMQQLRIGGATRATIADAQRAVAELDAALLDHATRSVSAGQAILDQIKSTRVGSLQHLSQRLREVILDTEHNR